MPERDAAHEHTFDEETLPDRMALDADFVVSVIVQSEQYHDNCAAFSARLIRRPVTIVYSPLLRFEFMHAWQKAVHKGAIPRRSLSQRAAWDEPQLERQELYRLGDTLLADFLNLFERFEIRLTNRLQVQALRMMALHDLKPMDACLVACALQSRVTDIVSLDRDFVRVDGIDLWNDLIPSKRRALRKRQR